MTGLDCNILVQLALADHPRYGATVSALKSVLSQDETLYCPTPVITEFLHIVSDPRRFDPPLAELQAAAWMEEFLSKPRVKLLPSSDASIRLMLRWLSQFGLGRKRIIDTHIAAILHTNGINRILTSDSRGFITYGVFEIITP